MTPELRSPLAVVCHDAGACNVILPWLARAGLALRPLMRGPAARLFASHFPCPPALTRERTCATDHERADERPDTALDAALDGAAMLLSGTGWASGLEHHARRLARARGIFSVAVIDHWVNYPDRFERGGETVWPDEFWVTDAHALAIACRCFPAVPVRCFDNLYLQRETAAVTPRLRDDAAQVLYVLEPMRSDWGRGKPGEFQALDYFMRERAAAGMPATAPIRLRPHPSDPAGKYDAWVLAQRARADVALDGHASLAEAIGASAWVVGCESFALVVALAAGRRVCSTLPPWAPPCRLPQPGIVHLGVRARGPVRRVSAGPVGR